MIINLLVHDDGALVSRVTSGLCRVIQVLEHGTPEQRDVIASILSGHAVQLALQVGKRIK
jgi:hypothetical protein